MPKAKGRARRLKRISNEHAELTAQYVFQCQRPEDLSGLHAALFVSELTWLSAFIVVALLASLVPGYRACKVSLSDGLSPRL